MQNGSQFEGRYSVLEASGDTPSVRFDNLKILVAEKLWCFPRLLELHYHLDTNKQKLL